MKKLAILGGTPLIQETIKPFISLNNDDIAAATRVIQSGCLSGYLGSPSDKFYGGIEVKKLEKDWCERFQVAHSISVNSATSGLIAAIGAIGISPGDEVIVPPYTMSATVIAPLFYGAIPVFVDIEDEYFCIDPVLVEQAITPKTKAIIAVNLFGHPAELSRLRKIADKYGIYLIEDNAQAILAKENNKFSGTIGHIGVFSLNVHKHLNVGEGGIVVTNDDELAKRLQLIRNHGENASEWMGLQDLTNIIGYNFRLSEIHAAIAQVQLSKLDDLTQRVMEMGEGLSEGIKDLPGIKIPSIRENCSHVYFMWSCRFDMELIGISRDLFCKALLAEGLPIAQGYVKPLYRLPTFQKRMAIGKNAFPFSLSDRTYKDNQCDVVERLHVKELFQFQPVSWDVNKQVLKNIINTFYKVYEALPALKVSTELECEH